jgi:hypothetical protein
MLPAFSIENILCAIFWGILGSLVVMIACFGIGAFREGPFPCERCSKLMTCHRCSNCGHAIY